MILMSVWADRPNDHHARLVRADGHDPGGAVGRAVEPDQYVPGLVEQAEAIALIPLQDPHASGGLANPVEPARRREAPCETFPTVLVRQAQVGAGHRTEPKPSRAVEQEGET